ncbi:hypothetical protein FQA39_LY05151 [Lamprigera yunnana]|nr:hypothetical protein FQA39_LY05151 [Lamprigera yunnana]
MFVSGYSYTEMIPHYFRNSLVTLIVVIHFTQAHVAPHNENLVVHTIYGRVKGTVQHSRNNRTFYSFRGMPFAKPPTGQLRFRAPLPPDPWKDIRIADQDGPVCIQKNYLFTQNPPVEGEEDCLYLNVYTPQLPDSKYPFLYKHPLPVMVFIHYGAFFAGSGTSDILGPEYIMDKNVILVTFNYRLGVFGFLSTSDDAASGNWALKDQVAALQWVQNNILFFGGNNKDITLFGQSAGAGSVHLHFFSPQTKGLFQRGISQSGSALAMWARPNNVLQSMIARQQATFVNCDSDTDTQSVVNCIRNVDATVLANSSDLFKTFGAEPFMIFGPVIEKKTALNPKPYLTEDPLISLQNGRVYNVPWIAGVVSGEGILRASPLLRDSKLRTQLNNNFDTIGSQILGIPLSVAPNEVAAVWDEIANFYLKQNFVNVSHPDNVQDFVDLYSDRSFIYGAYQSALMQAWKGNSPVWFYNFEYRGAHSYEKHFASTTEKIDFDWGVSHCDDLLYLFTSKKLFTPLELFNDYRMSKIMIELWTNFAIYGHPTPVLDVKASPLWPPLPNLQGLTSIKNKHLVYLNISGPHGGRKGSSIRLEIKKRFNKERMLFWKSLPLSENIAAIE